jgi:hypothetical protein
MSDELFTRVTRAAGSPPPGPLLESVPVQPEAVAGTDEPLRETARRSLVPRWIAALRTRVFSALAGFGLLVFGGMTMLVTGGLTADADLVATQTVQGIELPLFGPLMVGVSLPGFFPQSLLLIAAVALLFWRAGYRTESRFALVASASSDGRARTPSWYRWSRVRRGTASRPVTLCFMSPSSDSLPTWRTPS